MKKTLRYLTLCALLPATPIQAGDFKVLQLQYIMPHEYPWVNVITTEADWGNFYYNELLPANGINCHFPTESPFEQDNPCLTGPPDVNFKTSQVIVGGLGLKPSSGFQAMVADVDTTQPTDLVVNIIDGAPSDECILLPVISLEMMTLVVEKSDKPVKVNVQNATLHCETDGALSNY
ncbi:MAG: hypothetical protein AB2718_13055 [Candidatus Thiodiazotropha taylori]|nr:hypothetical protein [Candidatus Thiodiazotropha taylori]MCG7908698.1 hypothetical protein [Candidatus Thiodiazotropha taylori]MCG7934699.1 hypothetical protein [Candidatus Thiodiazotropha taylori]MCG7943816.1 hypothetical protein [Candidatus Thiodiazotropha taylori]MCG8066295.1 hypothetical protein [Candidatus Thiodiazotropha taylori]